MIYRIGDIIKDKKSSGLYDGLFKIVDECWGYDCVLRYTLWSLDEKTYKHGIDIPTMQNNYIKELYTIEEIKKNRIAVRVNSQEDCDLYARLFEETHPILFEESDRYNVDNLQYCLVYSYNIGMRFAKERNFANFGFAIIDITQIKELEGEKDMKKDNILEVKVEIKKDAYERGLFNFYINDSYIDWFKLGELGVVQNLDNSIRNMLNIQEANLKDYQNLLDEYLVEEEPKEITISELEKTLGYKVKIVGEK